MTNRRSRIPATLALACAVACSCASQTPNQPPQQEQLARAITAPDRVDPPEPLPAAARALLKQRMATHARDMSDLVSAIMLLEYSRIAIRAEAIAEEANWSRPITGDATELNAQLPEKFYVRQDDLKPAARRLAAAANSHNPYKVAAAYGQLSETCVRCHADFRPTLNADVAPNVQ
jgi:cytochrome c556